MQLCLAKTDPRSSHTVSLRQLRFLILFRSLGSVPAKWLKVRVALKVFVQNAAVKSRSDGFWRVQNAQNAHAHISPMSLSHATWMKGLSTCMRPTWWFIASHMVHRRSVALYERALTSLSTIRTAVRPRVLPTDGLSKRRRWRLLISQSQCFNKYLNYMQQTLRRGYWIGSQVHSFPLFHPLLITFLFPFSVSLLPFLTFQFNSIPV